MSCCRELTTGLMNATWPRKLSRMKPHEGVVTPQNARDTVGESVAVESDAEKIHVPPGERHDRPPRTAMIAMPKCLT